MPPPHIKSGENEMFQPPNIWVIVQHWPGYSVSIRNRSPTILANLQTI